MKKIFQIAKLELSTLFYSPIAWLLIIVFFIQCGINYTETLQGWITVQELGGDYKENIVFLTSNIFGPPGGLSVNMAYQLYLYLPLLTMGLISREISSGTIKLLYSSPVKTTDIVFGKFMAVCVYSFLLTLVICVYFVTGMFHLENADIGLLLSAALGIFLLLCAYGAIGLFVSSLTSYQVVAAISTFVVFAFLNYIGTVWQDIDFVRDITYSLTLANRIANMAGGLITTKDLSYFLIIMYIFIGLTILRLHAKRSTDSGLFKTLKYSVVIISALAIGYFTSRPVYTAYLDTTATKTRTLTKTSQKILAEMKDGPLEITSYINLLEDNFWNGVPVARNQDLERWLPYIRFKPDIKLNYVYYYDSIPESRFDKQYPGKSLDEIANQFSKSFRIRLDKFKKPGEIRKIIDLRPEKNRYVMHLKYNGKSSFLRLFDDPIVFPTERETGAALKRMIVKLPKIAFLEGELERSINKAGDRDYKMMTSLKTFRYSLINQGFDFTTINLKDGGEIPDDVDALVIADPRASLDTAVLVKIRKYIDAGRNLMIAGEPGKQQVLEPLLAQLGISMTEGMMVQKSEDFSPSLVLPYLTTASASFSKALAKALRDSIRVSASGVAGLVYDSTNGYNVQTLLVTDNNLAWRKVTPLSSDSLKVSFTPTDGDIKGTLPTMLSLSRKMNNGKEQRIIVSSDADFMSSLEVNRYLPRTANFTLNTALFGWLSYGEFPVDTERPESLDKKVLLSGDSIPLIKIVFLWTIPFIIFLIGAIILVRRKRK